MHLYAGKMISRKPASLLCSLFCLFPLRALATLSRSQYCFESCNAVLYSVPLKGGFDACSSKLFIESGYFCAAVYCSTNEITSYLQSTNETCRKEGYSLPSFESIVTANTDLDSIERVSEKDATRTSINHPVIPEPEYHALGRRTVVG